MEEKLGFGKYADKTYEEIWELDKYYCIWINNLKNVRNENIIAFQNYLEYNYDKELKYYEKLNNNKLKFGKYADKTYDEVYKLNKRYCNWIKKLYTGQIENIHMIKFQLFLKNKDFYQIQENIKKKLYQSNNEPKLYNNIIEFIYPKCRLCNNFQHNNFRDVCLACAYLK